MYLMLADVGNPACLRFFEENKMATGHLACDQCGHGVKMCICNDPYIQELKAENKKLKRMLRKIKGEQPMCNDCEFYKHKTCVLDECAWEKGES